MATKKQKLNGLAGVTMFEGLTAKQLDAVASYVTPTSRPAGTVLVTQGGPPRQLIILRSGKARVVRNGKTVATLGAGDVIGEIGLLDHQEATANVEATEDVDILVLSISDFQNLLVNEPRFARNVLQQVASRLRETDNRAYA